MAWQSAACTGGSDTAPRTSTRRSARLPSLIESAAGSAVAPPSRATRCTSAEIDLAASTRFGMGSVASIMITSNVSTSAAAASSRNVPKRWTCSGMAAAATAAPLFEASTSVSFFLGKRRRPPRLDMTPFFFFGAPGSDSGSVPACGNRAAISFRSHERGVASAFSGGASWLRGRVHVIIRVIELK